MGLKTANNASTTLSLTLSSGATTLQAADATRFSTLSSGSDYFWVTVVSASNPAVWEIIKVVGAFTPGTLATMSNLVRATDSTTSSTGAAQNWSVGDKLQNRVNSQTLTEFPRLSETNTFIAGQTIPGFALLASPTFTGTVTIPALSGGEAGTTAGNKSYIDTLIQSIKDKGSVRAATTSNITRSGAQTIDTISVIAGDLVLVKNQTAAAENGIFTVAAGVWTRNTNADTWVKLIGASVFVESNSSTQAGTRWVANINAGGVIDTTSVSFYESSGPLTFTPGTGISVSTAGQIAWSATGSTITTAIGSTPVTTSNQLGGVVAANYALLASPAFTGTVTYNSLEIGTRIVPQNIQSSNYTLALTDNGSHIYSTNAGAQTLTVPTNATIALPIGASITIVNNGTTAITLTTTGTTVYKAAISTVWASGGTLAIRGMVSLLKVATDTWFISGSGLS